MTVIYLFQKRQNMEIKLLPKSLRETLRSEVNIRSVAKCITQLVINSIDAKSASIAVRVNLAKFSIQVIDNGTGISKKNLKLVGFRHATSKYFTIEDLKRNPNILPSRGEALASIIKLSEIVKITTRCSKISKTFTKVFENGKSLVLSSVKQRPSTGTTIIIENFMYNLPVRKKSINQNTCLDEIKNEMEYIALIHPNTSFSLRNDLTGDIIFQTCRTKYVYQTTAILYGKEFSRQLRKICYNDRNFLINGLISLDSHAQNKMQFVYINSRFVPKTKIHTLINSLISKSKIIKNKEVKLDSPMVKQKYGAFIINIKCPYSEIDIVDYIEPEIEFKNWETVLTCVEEAIKQFLKAENLIEVQETKNNYLQNGTPIIESVPKVRTSQVAGVIRGIPMKRKLPSEKIEQSQSTNERINNEQTKIIVDVHPPPKKFCTEILRDKQSSPAYKSEITEKIIEQHNATLDSNSEYGKNMIMNMFLKSTRVFLNDDDLRQDDLGTFESADKYTNRSSSSCFLSTLKNNCNKTNVTASTKISVTKTIEHNINIENKYNTNVFKVPEIPKLKLSNRKSSATNDSIDVSDILARNKITRKKDKQEISKNTGLPNNFQLDFLKNISKRNHSPRDITNRLSKLLNYFTKEPKRKNYECTIKISKRLDYFQSSDFLQPAVKKSRYNNPAVLPKNSKKEIVYANSMIKTYFDLKKDIRNRQMINNKFKMHQNYLSYLNNKYSIEPLSTSFRKECSNNFLPIYNVKRNNDYKINNKEKYYEPKNKVTEDIRINFPSPQLSFKPFSTNPNLSNLFTKNNISIAKPNTYLNHNFSPPDNKIRGTRSKLELNSEANISSTFESHPFAKYFKNKQNVDLNSNLQFDFTNKQNGVQIFEQKKSCKKSKTESGITETPIKITYNKERNYEKINCKNNINNKYYYLQSSITPENNKYYCANGSNSNITFLPETQAVHKTPIKISYKTKNIEHLKYKNTFLNYLQSSITPENYKYYCANSLNSNITFLPETQAVHETPIKVTYKTKNNENLEYENIFLNFPQSSITPENNKYDSVNVANSNITFLPETQTVHETPIKIQYNTHRNNENFERENTFLNFAQNKTTPENNTSRYYDNINVANSNITFLPETPVVPETPIKVTYKTHINNNNFESKGTLLNFGQSSTVSENNNSKYFDYSNVLNCTGISKNIVESSVISENKSNSVPIENENQLITYENLNTSNVLTPEIFSNNNSKEVETMNKIKKSSLVSSNYSSPIITSLSHRKMIANNYNSSFQQNNEQLENHCVISSAQFSSVSNLIEENSITNILNTLDQSIMNDTLNITNFGARDFNKNDINLTQNNTQILVSEKESNNICEANLETPVFHEDSSNLILENTRNIDEILKLHVSNDTNMQTNLSNIQHENNSEIHNKSYETSNNLQSNLLSKNAKESKNINQIETENDEYGNQMSEWVKKTSEFGNSYYLNLRTGMTSFGTPKNIDGCLVTKRHSFMPKGMSPIMLPTSTVISKELSPKSKNVLHQTIANTENDELQTVKWINFLKNKDSEQFFSDLYSCSKNYETEILNINQYHLPKKIAAGFNNYSFSKDDFNNITVINQCDNKFIVTKILLQEKYDLLVLFDQHAVHERIRLETLLKDYEETENKLKSVKCKNTIKLTLDDFEIRMLQNYQKYFENWGMFYVIKDKQNVTFTQIPLCWQTKDDSNLKHKEYSIIESLIMTLIQEESSWLKNIRKINTALPLAIQNTIKTEACRTAIKFGDSLSKEQCENLINELLLCDLPFNCAHGRPTIVPIIDLNNINDDDEDEEININILKT